MRQHNNALSMPHWTRVNQKNEISNFRLVSILNTSAKIYEKVIKDQLVSGLERYFSPFISAYRKRFCTQHVLIRLVEEWRE